MITNRHQASSEFNGSRNISHLIDRVTQVVQDFWLRSFGVLTSIHLSQGLLHPQYCMVIVIIIVRCPSHVKAVIHSQKSIEAHTCGLKLEQCLGMLFCSPVIKSSKKGRKSFSSLPFQNVFLWTCIITDYSQSIRTARPVLLFSLYTKDTRIERCNMAALRKGGKMVDCSYSGFQ